MTLTALARGALAKVLARALILALVVGLGPLQAQASTSSSPIAGADWRSLPEPESQPPPDVQKVLICVVVGVADPSGLTKSAFGELLAHTGTDPQPYAFAGEPYDPNVGFQYHRARWMDPRTGRFVSTDPFLGLQADPISLHRYLYAHASPTGNIDPSGEQTLGQSITVGAIIGVLAAQLLPARSFEERLRLTLFGAALGSIGGALYAGAALGGTGNHPNGQLSLGSRPDRARTAHRASARFEPSLQLSCHRSLRERCGDKHQEH